MEGNMKKTLLFLALFIYSSSFVSGCGKTNNTNNMNKSTTLSRIEEVDSVGGEDCIENYYIEMDIQKPLNSTKVSDNTFYKLLNEIESMYSISSDTFRLSNILKYIENPSFRKLDFDNKTHYYSIVEKINGDKCILLFTTFYPDIWSCSEYLILDNHSQPVSYSIGNNNAETKRANLILSKMPQSDLAY